MGSAASSREKTQEDGHQNGNGTKGQDEGYAEEAHVVEQPSSGTQPAGAANLVRSTSPADVSSPPRRSGSEPQGGSPTTEDVPQLFSVVTPTGSKSGLNANGSGGSSAMLNSTSLRRSPAQSTSCRDPSIAFAPESISTPPNSKKTSATDEGGAVMRDF